MRPRSGFGRIHPDKGTAAAIEAAAAAGVPLLIGGIVQDQDYFDELVRPRIDGDRVRFLGPVAAEGRSAFLGEALALLHLIDFDEPFGFSVAEAMACGTPVVAYARGSMGELIDDGRTGFLVSDLEAAVAAIARCQSLDRAAIRASAVERFSVDRMVDEYVRVYEGAIARAGG